MRKLIVILTALVLAMIAGCASSVQPPSDSPVHQHRDPDSVTAVISKQAIAHLTIEDTASPAEFSDFIDVKVSDQNTLQLGCKPVEGIAEFHAANGNDGLPKETALLNTKQAPGDHQLVSFLGDTWTMYKPYFMIVRTYTQHADGYIQLADDRLLDLRDYKFQAGGGMWLDKREFAVDDGMLFGDPLICTDSAFAKNSNQN